jgi:hypothetical protein
MKLGKEIAVKKFVNYVDQGFLCVETVLKTLSEINEVDLEYMPAISIGLAV